MTAYFNFAMKFAVSGAPLYDALFSELLFSYIIQIIPKSACEK